MDLPMFFFSRPSAAILLVCTANICRSPMAEVLLREKLKRLGLHRKIKVDSAGTHATQVGHPADPRAREVCAREGIDLRKCRARQVKEKNFLRFDYILAMDELNYQWLLEACPETHRERISQLGAWIPQGAVVDIPDPYYGSLAGFELVLSMLHDAIDGFLDRNMEELNSVDK